MNMALPESILRCMAEGEVENKAKLREEIAEHVAEYLAQGGIITQLPPEASYWSEQPYKRKRRDQVEHVKRFHKIKAA